MRKIALAIVLLGSAGADYSVGVTARLGPAEIVPALDHGSLGHDSACCHDCGWSRDGSELASRR